MNLNFYVCLVALTSYLAPTNSCSPKNRQKHHLKEDQAGTYSFVPPISRSCTDKRTNNVRYNFNHESVSETCGRLVPGIDKMMDGVSMHHYSSSPKDTPPQHSSVFSFTCNETIGHSIQKFENFTVPSQIKRIKPKPRTVYDRHIISSSSLLHMFLDDIQLKKPANEFVLNLAQLNLTVEDTFRSAGFVSMRVETYYVELLPNVLPSKSVTKEYSLLPKTLRGNERQYYDFIKRFGTHVIMEAVYGGQFLVLVTHSREKDAIDNAFKINRHSVDSLINEVMALEQGHHTKISSIVTGGHPDNQNNVEIWAGTVADEPVPISCQYMPIGTFMEKDNHTVKSQNLEKMTLYEKDVNQLKRLYFELDVVPLNNSLAVFIKKTLSKEVEYVCTSFEVTGSITNGVLLNNNIQLNMFGINCTIEYEDKKDIKNVQRIYNLIPGVCLTFQRKAVTCDTLEFAYPEGIACFVFYDEPGCPTVSRTRYVRMKDQINNDLPNAKSMRFCTTDESNQTHKTS